MKTLEDIKKVISEYDELHSLARSKILLLESIDPVAFNTYKYVDEISFEMEHVHVVCDDSHGDWTDYYSFDFPLSYLVMDEDELTELVKQSIKDRIEKERLLKEQKRLAEKEKHDKFELEQYLKLKRKFEDK